MLDLPKRFIAINCKVIFLLMASVMLANSNCLAESLCKYRSPDGNTIEFEQANENNDPNSGNAIVLEFIKVKSITVKYVVGKGLVRLQADRQKKLVAVASATATDFISLTLPIGNFACLNQ